MREKREKEKGGKKREGEGSLLSRVCSRERERRAIFQKWRVTKRLEIRVMMVPY
jgi:hypothetical protein